MKWGYVLWMNKTFSVLPMSKIKRENNRIIVLAQFDDGKYYKAKLLAEGDDRELLNTLYVQKTGVIDFSQSELTRKSSNTDDVESQSIVIHNEQPSMVKEVMRSPPEKPTDMIQPAESTSSPHRSSSETQTQSLRNPFFKNNSFLCGRLATAPVSHSARPGNELIYHDNAASIPTTRLNEKGKKFPLHKSKFILPRVHDDSTNGSSADDPEVEILTVMRHDKSTNPNQSQSFTSKISQSCSKYSEHRQYIPVAPNPSSSSSPIILSSPRPTPCMIQLDGFENSFHVNSLNFERETPTGSLASLSLTEIPFSSSSQSRVRKSPEIIDISGGQQSAAARGSQKTSLSLQSHSCQSSSGLSSHSQDRTKQTKSRGTSPIVIRLPRNEPTDTGSNEEHENIPLPRRLSLLTSGMTKSRPFAETDDSIAPITPALPYFKSHQRSLSTSSTPARDKSKQQEGKLSRVHFTSGQSCSRNGNRHNESSHSTSGPSTSKVSSISEATPPPPERSVEKCEEYSDGSDSDTPDDSDSSDSDEGSTVDWRRNGRNQVELISGSGVYVDRAELGDMRKRWLRKPTELVRRLLKHMIPGKELLKMTRTGLKNREPIPREVLRAIKKFMRKEVPRQLVLSTYKYNQCITKFCDNYRKSKKRR